MKETKNKKDNDEFQIFDLSHLSFLSKNEIELLQKSNLVIQNKPIASESPYT